MGMDELVTIRLTRSELLTIFIALTKNAVRWGDIARKDEARGDDGAARAARSVRAENFRLSDLLDEARRGHE